MSGSFPLEKSANWSLTITARITDPVSASAVISYPNGTTRNLVETTLANGTMVLSYHVEPTAASGTYVLTFSVIGGPNTIYGGASVDSRNYNTEQFYPTLVAP